MSIIGLDIGTTTLSAVVLEEGTHRSLHRETLPHGAFLPAQPHEKIQDAEKILSLSLGLIASLRSAYGPVSAIGLTGQMHGIVYTDAEGKPVSPLYTWQDGRGNLPLPDGRRFSDALSEETGYPLASGYGAVTHAYLLRNGLLPENAARFSTIHSCLAMLLTGRKLPLLHASDAASLGLYDLSRGEFDRQAIERLGADFFPETTGCACVMGETEFGEKVVTAVGDNQASFIGATSGEKNAALVNIGTGSQVSVRTDRLISCKGCETRPLDGGEYLLVGAPLCGGRAYAILEKFLRECAALAGVQPEPLYEKMNALAMTAPENPLCVSTAFCGTRENPSSRGAVANLGEDNFTPAHLIHGVLTGMAEELHEYYLSMVHAADTQADQLIASGNAVRRNPALGKILSEVFSLPLLMPDCEEEAATGAALLAERAVREASTYRR